VEFDGTGISVFELKREIINKSGLGDGTDFDLYIYTDDNSEGESTDKAALMSWLDANSELHRVR
jgi:protein MPE1